MEIPTLDVVGEGVDCRCLTNETAPEGAVNTVPGPSPLRMARKGRGTMIPTPPQLKLPNVERIQWYQRELERGIRECEESGNEAGVRHFKAVQHGFEVALYYIAGGK